MQRILVADDNDESLYLLQALFTAAGYEVVAVRNGAEALQTAIENPPSLVVTDILMPVMDGFTLCKRWRSESHLAKIPFAFYTATYTDPRDRELGLSIGADEFLVKPTEPEILLETVRDLLRRKQAGELPDRTAAAPETTILREYNSTLIRKLEDKLVQLEATNQKLAEAEALVRAVIDNSPLPIIAVDDQDRILLANPAFSSVFGYSDAEATEKRCSDLIGDAGDDFEPAFVPQRTSGEKPDPHRSKRRRKDGTLIDVEIYSGPIKLRDHAVGKFVIFRDITEQRKLEEELRHSQKMEAMGRLAGGIAHDFNNLLMLISGYIGLLADSGLSSEQRTICDDAVAATRRAASLTRQLLAFSRKQRELLVVTDLNAVLSNMLGMLRSLVSERIRLDIQLSDNPVPILVDVSQVEIVVLNLAINSRDAMPEGGILSVSTGRENHNLKTQAVLTVSDTGRGMTPEVKERIFEPFFTTKQAGQGTGLGLSTVSGIVQRFGGHIEVESQVHRGTQFRVFLPETTTAPTPTISSDASRVPPAGGNETILLAEDEFGIREMTRAYLEGLGYKVLGAADGAEAVKISREYKGQIDIVLTDLAMPTLRGDAVLQAIREDRPEVKALYMSGYSEDDLSDEVADVLHKPFEFPELGNRLRSVLDSRASTRSRARKE